MTFSPKTVFEILLVLVAWSMTPQTEAIDQKKVDQVVDDEIALYYHHDDAVSAIEALKKARSRRAECKVP